MRLEGIHVSFDKRGIAGLHGIDLHLKPGEVFAVMGISGAGKTTLLKVLAGEITPQGKIDVPHRVSMMSGASDWGYQGNVQEGLVKAIKRPLTTEQKIQLTRDLADSFEFTFQLKQNASELSEGQRQRVRLAEALIDAPELLLLDEPFAHLDGPLREELLTLLQAYVRERGITTVWVTHQSEDALPWADRLGIMHFGKWEQVNTPEEVFWRPRTLVVAQLLGHRNLVTVNRQDPAHHWHTPFGPWNSQGIGYQKTHLVLSIPPHAFKLDPQGPWSGKVVKKAFMGHHGHVTVDFQGQNWLAQWNGSSLTNTRVGEIIRFSVDLSFGVGIDCL